MFCQFPRLCWGLRPQTPVGGYSPPQPPFFLCVLSIPLVTPGGTPPSPMGLGTCPRRKRPRSNDLDHLHRGVSFFLGFTGAIYSFYAGYFYFFFSFCYTLLLFSLWSSLFYCFDCHTSYLIVRLFLLSMFLRFLQSA